MEKTQYPTSRATLQQKQRKVNLKTEQIQLQRILDIYFETGTASN